MENEGLNPPIKVNSDPIYGQDAEFIDFFVPGIMAFVVYLPTTLLTLLAFVGKEHQENTWTFAGNTCTRK